MMPDEESPSMLDTLTADEIVDALRSRFEHGVLVVQGEYKGGSRRKMRTWGNTMWGVGAASYLLDQCSEADAGTWEGEDGDE
jgi:hypothetical protein